MTERHIEAMAGSIITADACSGPIKLVSGSDGGWMMLLLVEMAQSTPA